MSETNPPLIDGRWLPVARGVPSQTWPELHAENTWFMSWHLAEEDAAWVVPEGEQPYVVFGLVDIADTVNPRMDSGMVTIPDASRVDVRTIEPTGRRLTREEVAAYFDAAVEAISYDGLHRLEDELRDDSEDD